MKKLYYRFIGLLIILKVVIPPLVFITFLTVFSYLFRSTASIVQEVGVELSQSADSVQIQIDTLLSGVKELKDKITDAKDSATEFTEDAKRAIRPITASLKGIQTASLSVLGAVAIVINKIRAPIEKITFGKIKLKAINLDALRDLDLIPIDFPDLDVDLSLDMSALEELERISSDFGTKLSNSVDDLVKLVQTWALVIFICIALLVLWILILFIGFLCRLPIALRTGWRLIKGEHIEGAVLYL